MSEPFIAEIHIVGFTFAPRGYAFCDGQTLDINQHQALFSLLGTNYGGDGRTTFRLPDMRGRTPIHSTRTSVPGNIGGEEQHVLTADEIPPHTHTADASGDQATDNVPAGNVLAGKARRTDPYYTAPAAAVHMHAGTVGNSTGGSGHNNMQPYLTLNYVIALVGIFPSRN